MNTNVTISKYSNHAIRVMSAKFGPADKSYIEYRVSLPIGTPPVSVISQRLVSRSGEIGRDDPIDYRTTHQEAFERAHQLALNQARQWARTDGKIIDETQSPQPESQARPPPNWRTRPGPIG